MTPFQRRRNPYVNRMIQDMQIRNFAASTIDSYTWHVDRFCRHFGKMPDELGLEEIRQYQIYLVNEKRSSWSTFNQAVCALRFLYEVTLGKPWAIQHIPFGRRPKKLPVVLSDQEASRLIGCTENPKHRMVLLCCYAAGLRLAEATHLKVADIDGQRAQIRVRSGPSECRRARPAQGLLWNRGRMRTLRRPSPRQRLPQKHRRRQRKLRRRRGPSDGLRDDGRVRNAIAAARNRPDPAVCSPLLERSRQSRLPGQERSLQAVALPHQDVGRAYVCVPALRFQLPGLQFVWRPALPLVCRGSTRRLDGEDA